MRLKTPLLTEDFQGALIAAVCKVVFKKEISSREVDTWIAEHSEEIASEFQSFAAEAIRRVHNPKRTPAAPVVSLKMKGGEQIHLWAYDAGQPCNVSEASCHSFGPDQTAGLVYETIGAGGHRAEETSIVENSIWPWVQKWMKHGLVSAGLMDAKEISENEQAA